MEWLALMRHYGAPCRLLDWTHTFWAAVFFAIEKATDFCSVWVVDPIKPHLSRLVGADNFLHVVTGSGGTVRGHQLVLKYKISNKPRDDAEIG